MSSVAVTKQVQEINVVKNVTEISLLQTDTGVEIDQVIHELSVNPEVQQVTIMESPLEVTVAAGVPGPQGPPGPAGSLDDLLVDGDTILGDGVNSPLSAPDMLRISKRLAEFETAAEREEAVTNLGLHIIDGGTFIY